MPASNKDPLSPSLPPNQSNENIAAQTVSDTVMAEQISHNVVDNIELTSAAAPVDVAANPTTTAFADHGNLEHSLPQRKPDEVQISQSINEHATNANSAINTTNTSAPDGEAIVDPSAGETITPPSEALVASLAAGSITGMSSESAQFLNGATGKGDGFLDTASAHEGSVDVSINSDAEGSRGDANDPKNDDEKHHNRSNSVKKPTTFSKVSVTKNYLAKSAPVAQATTKAGDKPTPVGTPPTLSAARPRLIAKTGASIQQKARLGSEGPSGPDASKVWNKNQRMESNILSRLMTCTDKSTAVAPPPPKQFTDEELKQQYGIHLATRLQTDENGKDKTWADIDDDEDDWAPESVVWMDGTKSTLTPSEVPTPLKEQKPSSPQPQQKPADGVRPTLAVKRMTELGPMKTILKPGANAAAAQAKQNGVSPTSGNEKTANVQGVVPSSKSPWAALPPIDKVSPINPPVQQLQSLPPRFGTQDARAYEPQPPTQPAREIAADTFDRSWHEGEGGARELFNSANGRYEPVTEGHRGSIKPDSSQRKPSLLQRSSQAAGSPAEPSAAFQTRSATHVDPSLARRRGSSVSQGSLPSVRRVSTSKGSDLSPAPEGRTSTVIGHDMRASPKMARNELAQPTFQQQNAWQQQMPARPEPGTEVEDPVKAQERIMRKKREEAKKRRQEVEAREEAEKQKRLQARLAALEGAGKSRKEREAEAAAAASAASTSTLTETPSEVITSTLQAGEARPQPANPAEMSTAAAPALEAQSLPAAPVEPHPIASPDEELPSPLPQKAHFTGLSERPNASVDQEQRQAQKSQLSPSPNARAPFQAQPSTYSQAPPSYSSPGERKLQPFPRSPMPNSDAFSSPWPTAPSHTNVWGSSGIGNGTFASSTPFAPMQQTSALPPPPGMTRSSQPDRISPQGKPQGSRSPSLQQQTMAEPPRNFAPPGFESRQDPFANQSRNTVSSPAPGFARAPHAPGPIAPPSRTQQQSEDKLRAWNRAAETLPEQYRSDAEAAVERNKLLQAAPRENTIKETFRKTSTQQGRLGAPRKYEESQYTIHDAQGSRSVQSLSPTPPYVQTQPPGPFSTMSPLHQDPWKQSGERTVRIPDGSLTIAQGDSPSQQPPIAPPSTSHQQRAVTSPLPPVSTAAGDSPPPPESSLHPVSGGDVRHPLVRLPPGKPVVKLPPAAPQSQPSSVPQHNMMMPQRPISNWGAPGSSKPIVMQQAWQERFNGLFNRTPIQTEVPPSPPKTPPKAQGPALAVAASSRTVMDEPSAANGATVSLPPVARTTTADGFAIDYSSDAISKPSIEDMFMDEQSHGYKPVVSVPKAALYHDAMFDDAKGRIPLISGVPQTSQVQSNSVQQIRLWDVHAPHREGIFAHIPGTKLRNRLIKFRHHKTSTNYEDRRPSGRFNKGRGNESTAAPTANPAAQNNAAAKTEATSNQGSPAAPSTPASEAKGSTYPKPRRGGAGRRAHTQPQTVKATL